AEEVVAGVGGLGAVLVEGVGGGNADSLEEGAGEGGDGLELARVAGVGIVDGVDEQLGEELGDVEVVEDGREAAGGAARSGATFAAGGGGGVGMAGVVEEAEGAVGEGVSAAGLAIGSGVGAAGGHECVPFFGERVRKLGGGRTSPRPSATPLHPN